MTDLESCNSEHGSSGTQQSSYDDSTSMLTASIARRETRVIQILRIAVILVLILTTALVSSGIYLYTSAQERENFESNFEDSAHLVIKSFSNLVERHIEAAAWMSTSITSHALQANESFPMVTLPHFSEQGSHFRALSGSHVVHYMPLVSDENRDEFERFALEHRFQIDDAFQQDLRHRQQQDAILGGDERRSLQEGKLNMTVLQDETGYHPKIWRTGALMPPGDEPIGNGPFIPLWQRSPIDGAKQSILNMNFAQTRALRAGLVETMAREKKAVLNSAAVPIPEIKKRLEANLRLSQFREKIADFVDGLSTFLSYPVFDSFEQDRKVAGVLATNIYWKILFTDLLPSLSQGVICVVENSFNQTFTYRIDGEEAIFLGMGAMNDPKYDHLSMSIDVGEYLQSQATVQKRAYASVPLNNDASYILRVFPSRDMEDQYVTSKPILYTLVAISAFAFTSILFLAFSYVVEKRQHIMITNVVKNAKKAATAERELNEFLSHEVRNPLSAAISACSFVSTALNEETPLTDRESRKSVREDIEVVHSSLHFINDFLRSMLDIHRASGNQIKIEKSPTDLLRDVFEPVSAILYKRMAAFEVIVDCPGNLLVMTDSIRLKQVVLNLVRNSSKFVEKGFIRMRAGVTGGTVKLFVEDSGPGIPLERRKQLFNKYQESLDLLSQGTGLGLALSKKLMHTMEGDIWLDESYDSGLEGSPGACFVVELNTPPLNIESTVLTESESEPSHVIAAEGALLGCIQEENLSIDAMESQSHSTATTGIAKQPIIDGMDKSALPENVETKAPTNVVSETAPETPPELPEELSVLFVDDDAILRKLFVRAVKRAQPGWEIQEASCGETAIQLCESHRFDLIFLDQYMASVEKRLLGTETAQAMRTKGIDSVICGLSANNIRDLFVSAGANDFVLKPMPCKPDDLRQVLRRVLDKSTRKC